MASNTFSYKKIGVSVLGPIIRPIIAIEIAKRMSVYDMKFYWIRVQISVYLVEL